MFSLPRMALAPQQRRRMAVALTLDGEAPEQVADVLDVSERSVWRWLGAFRAQGDAGLLTRPGQGRPPKLSDAQARQVLNWLGQSPCSFGFVTERWTAPRVALLIARPFDVQRNHRYLNDWPWRHGRITPQVPERRARERDEGAIRRWIDERWPLIKKRRCNAARA